MANIKEPAEMQTPNTVNTEVQETVQANTIQSQNGYQSSDTIRRLETWNPEAVKNKMNDIVQPQQTTDATQNVAQQNVMSQVQAVQPVQNQSNIAVKIPSDLYDQTVQGYLDEFRKGQEINDYQAQINALNAIDQYRTTQGYKPIYTSNVYELTNQRVQKIKNQIRDYEADMAEAINSGNEALAQQIGQQMEAYKKAVNYGETVNNSATYLQNIEYKSTYDSVISGIVNELLTTRFTYDPSDDEALLKAQQYATNSVYESMNAKGILDSTMTAQIVAKTANELIPIYEKMAKEDFYNNLERLQSMANFVMNLEETQYSRWLDQVQVKLDYYEAQKDEIAYQWDRVNQLGYVDNEASIILGVAPGTMSPSMREAIDEAERQANEQYNKLYSDIALAKAKAEIEAKLYATKKSIDSQYKTTSVSGTSSSGTTIYSGTDTNKKNAIADAYKLGEKTASQTIGDAIVNSIDKDGNVKDADVKAILEEAFKGTATSYEETLTNISNALANEAVELIGEINEETKDAAIVWLGSLNDKGYFDFVGGDTVINNLTEKFDKGISKTGEDLKVKQEFDEIYKAYQNTVQTRIDTVKNIENEYKNIMGNDTNKTIFNSKPLINVWDSNKYANDSLEKIVKSWEILLDSITEKSSDLTAKYGTDNYNKLVEMVSDKEEELKEMLKEKGIDW